MTVNFIKTLKWYSANHPTLFSSKLFGYFCMNILFAFPYEFFNRFSNFCRKTHSDFDDCGNAPTDQWGVSSLLNETVVLFCNFYLPSFWRTFFSSCCIHLQVTSSFRFVCLFVLCQKKSLFHLNFGKVFLLDIEFYLDSFFVFFSFQYMERKTSCLTFSFALLLKRNKLLSWLTHAAVTGYHGLGGL